MLSATLLENKLSIKFGANVLKFEGPDKSEKCRADYQLVVKTAFEEYVNYLQAQIPLEKQERYLQFFRTLVSKGAPAETLVCAAVLVDSDSKQEASNSNIKKTCDDWFTTIDRALQLAVIEYLTNMSQIEDSIWQAVIHKLLTLNADPHHTFADFDRIIAANQWALPLVKTHSAFTLTVSAPISYKMKALLIQFNHELKKQSRSLSMTPEQFKRLFPKAHETRGPFGQHPWIKQCEENFPDYMRRHIAEYANDLIQEYWLQKDFLPIDWLRDAHQVDVFPHLIEREEKERDWASSFTFHYLKTYYAERLKSFIQQNFARISHRFQSTLLKYVAENNFPAIVQLQEEYQINFIPMLFNMLLLSNTSPWFEQSLFLFLNEKDPEFVSKELEKNLDFLMKKFLDNNDANAIESMSQYPFFNIKVMMDRLIIKLPRNRHGLLKENIFTHPEFKDIAARYPLACRKYFFNLDLEVGRMLFSNINAAGYAASYYNVNVFRFFKELEDEEYAQLGYYYQHQARSLLNYISFVRFPELEKALVKNDCNLKICTVEYNGAVLTLSVEFMEKIFKKLQQIVSASPTLAARGYLEMRDKVLMTVSETRDPTEKQFYADLFHSGPRPAHSVLHQYLDDVYFFPNYLPFLMPLRNKLSAKDQEDKAPISRVFRQNKLYDQQLVKLLFSFVGHYRCTVKQMNNKEKLAANRLKWDSSNCNKRG